MYLNRQWRLSPDIVIVHRSIPRDQPDVFDSFFLLLGVVPFILKLDWSGSNCFRLKWDAIFFAWIYQDTKIEFYAKMEYVSASFTSRHTIYCFRIKTNKQIRFPELFCCCWVAQKLSSNNNSNKSNCSRYSRGRSDSNALQFIVNGMEWLIFKIEFPSGLSDTHPRTRGTGNMPEIQFGCWAAIWWCRFVQFTNVCVVRARCPWKFGTSHAPSY